MLGFTGVAAAAAAAAPAPAAVPPDGIGLPGTTPLVEDSESRLSFFRRALDAEPDPPTPDPLELDPPVPP
jgi:hypothetical protein